MSPLLPQRPWVHEPGSTWTSPCGRHGAAQRIKYVVAHRIVTLHV